MVYPFGYTTKSLTQLNWLELDEMLAAQIPDTDLESLAHEEWMAPLFRPQLTALTPKAVHDRFELARGLFCYSTFYHPLFSVGMEKLYQALEWALILRCEQMGYRHHEASWKQAVVWLSHQKIIDVHQSDEWESLMLSRYSQEQNQLAYMNPTYAITGLELAANLINALYQAAPVQA